MTEELKGKRVLVLGLGRSGVAAARYCVSVGARVTASDLKSADQLRPALEQLADLPMDFELGGHDPAAPRKFDLVVISPGVSPDLPGLCWARTEGVPVVSEMELAVRLLDQPMVAVTGTNGKTTTASLIGHLLSQSGMPVCVAGNIGQPLLGALDLAARSQVVVLEVSSFQIETSPSLTPWVAVWLNATPDHLDRHKSFQAYVNCKARLFSQVPPGGWGIYNAADPTVAQAVTSSGIGLIPFDATGDLISLSTGVGSNAGRAWFEGDDLWVNIQGQKPNRYSLKNVSIKGAHNRENMLAALAAAEICGAQPVALSRAMESFVGLPHRMELVGWHRGVRYVDDSKGTNVGATIRALEECTQPVVLIAGGRAKGTDFAPLVPLVRQKVKKLVLIGEAARTMDSVFSGCTESVHASTMEDAVCMASGAASPGEIVLLSPACSSLDMFVDYAERGLAFARAVSGLAGREDHL
jgi:UDP-N-acetylmuramoylalanine--D-glutamate ligase